MITQKALVENPYYGKNYDGKFGWANQYSHLFSNHSHDKFVEIDVFCDENEYWQPYNDRLVSTKVFLGCKIGKFV